MGSSGFGTEQQVTQAVAQAIRNRDGQRLAAALQLDLGNTSLLTQLGSQSVQLEALCGTALEEPYDEMLLEHFQFLRAVIRDDHVQAFAHQERACTCFQSVFEKDSAWSLPVLHVLDLDLRLAAQRDEEAARRDGPRVDHDPLHRAGAVTRLRERAARRACDLGDLEERAVPRDGSGHAQPSPARAIAACATVRSSKGRFSVPMI